MNTLYARASLSHGTPQLDMAKAMSIVFGYAVWAAWTLRRPPVSPPSQSGYVSVYRLYRTRVFIELP